MSATNWRGSRSDADSALWWLVGVGVLIALMVGLRMSTRIADRGPVFDERWITRPIAEIIRKGWSVPTAIDFQETKGPAMIWPYALWGQLFISNSQEVVPEDVSGGGRGSGRPEAWTSPIPGGPAPAPPKMLATLRMFSMVCFVLGGALVMLLAGMCGVRGPPLCLIAVLYALLPYQLVFGQIVMGEVSFFMLAALMLLVVVWGMGDGRRSVHPIAGPVFYAILLAVLLHSRIHAIAFAPAVCFVAWQRLDLRSWPWWLASALAGLSRLPLWARWGGPVSSDFQTVHGLGIRLESLTYLGAAMAVPLGVFLIAWLIRWRREPLGWLPPAGVIVGLLLSLVAMPDMSVPDALDLSLVHDRFQGLIASLTQLVAGTGTMRMVLIALACMLGLGGLGALLTLAHRWRVTSLMGVMLRIQAFTLGAGWLLYALTRGFVFDRYLLVWAVALPISWLVLLPRWLLAVQTVGLLATAAMVIRTWLL
ncbi:MAG: hypothetical protein MK101_04225 [Phycisphaerales bacterium]|nr:hypothetical protein [Phycisphaerales bacterium]